MALNRDRSAWFQKHLIGVCGVFLISGCEAAPTPLERAAALTEQPSRPLITSVTTRVRDDTQPGRMDGVGETRREVNRPDGLDGTTRAAATPSTSLDPSASETEAEDARITSFGTEIRMPFSGPFSVTAYTTTSRATRITHAIWVSKTVGGRSHTTTLNDDSGFFNQTSLFTTVGLSGNCETPTTLEAQTKHTAGSILVARQFAISEAEESCGTPTETCGSDEGGPDDVTVQGAGDDVAVAADCPGGGPAPGGETTPYTCYTTVTDYYWYYPDTDTYEYRYSEETTWCEQAAT